MTDCPSSSLPHAPTSLCPLGGTSEGSSEGSSEMTAPASYIWIVRYPLVYCQGQEVRRVMPTKAGCLWRPYKAMRGWLAGWLADRPAGWLAH